MRMQMYRFDWRQRHWNKSPSLLIGERFSYNG